ncbi:type II toxin-antitoxin system RelE/ParE family toxin [Pannus brasiliensis CCIBt3594]|uniref:Type II toxin-antitoxin system RelE/ParE family toxin n=1 Tax=Pannus brasiliensis CCIBt3594 TaxID=1427578 RepID=A0AAW9QWM9_9CHRO
MRIFKNKWFAKFARKEGISDARLREAVSEIESGRIDADYGGGVIKQRIARTNEGKSGGYRSVILYQRGNKAFFVYGFAKSERDNIDEDEERGFKDLAKVTFSFSEEELAKLVERGVYKEIKGDDPKKNLQE